MRLVENENRRAKVGTRQKQDLETVVEGFEVWTDY